MIRGNWCDWVAKSPWSWPRSPSWILPTLPEEWQVWGKDGSLPEARLARMQERGRVRHSFPIAIVAARRNRAGYAAASLRVRPRTQCGVAIRCSSSLIKFCSLPVYAPGRDLRPGHWPTHAVYAYTVLRLRDMVQQQLSQMTAERATPRCRSCAPQMGAVIVPGPR